MKLSKVFEPIQINRVTVKNRMVVSAMVTNYCDEDGLANEKFIAYHEHKAQGGFGLIVTEDYAVTPTAGGFKRLPGLWEDRQVPSHRQLTDRVHAAGARIFAQLYHAGRETNSAITGVHNVAPSAIKDPTSFETPYELTVDQIHELVGAFGDAARRAKEAGFDGVEIHGAHGYLVEQFLSTFSNRRGDEYGGSIQNRCRFLTEIIGDIRKKCGSDFAIQLRISGQEYVPGGLGIEDSKVIAMIAEDAGIDSISVSQGVYASMPVIIPPSVIRHAAYIDNAAEIKSVVTIPVLGVGRINDPFLAESILRSGKADLCIMARASLADPEMPKKAAEGRFDEIIRCVGCLQGCAGENGKGCKVRCLVNPMTGMEDEYQFEKAADPKHILVIGGGVAGCECAIVAAQRGHKVTLLEKTGELGGQFIPAAIPVGKGEFNTFVIWQKTMLRKLGVEIRYNTSADRATVDSIRPDAVVIATGSTPAVPPIPGLQENAKISWDILRGVESFGNRVVVIGGGLVGAETADHVAVHGAGDVTVIEMREDIVMDGEPNPTYYMKQRFAEHDVQILTSAAVQTVEPHAVVYRKDGREHRIEDVDTIVNATGVRPNQILAKELEDAAYPVIVIGDARSGKNGYLDIREGYEAGLTL